MKRNRAPAAPSTTPDPPTKTQKRCKDPGAKGAGKARAASAEKPLNKDDGDAKWAAATAAAVSSPAALEAAQQEEAHAWWDGVGEFGWLWGSGVEEELLLGWFPFVDEHFLCSESRAGSGLFWEEDHDIWQLQHIHEIPNSAK